MCTRHVFLATIKKLVVEEGWTAEFYNKRRSVRLYCPNGHRYTPIEAVVEFGKNGGNCATLVSDLDPRAIVLIEKASCNICFENATHKDKKAFHSTRIGLLNSCGLREIYPTQLSRF